MYCERVVHPAHVPLQPEPQTAAVGRPGHALPGGGLLGDGDDAGAAAVHRRVHLLQERHRVQVLPAAVARSASTARVPRSSRGRASTRRRPPAGRRHGTPRTSKRRSPPGSCAPPSARSRTRACPSPGARPAAESPGSYSGSPSNRANAQSSLGKCAGTQSTITPIPARCSASTRYLKSSGRAESGGRRVEAGDLVAPGAAEGVLGDRHELHMGEAEVADVSRQQLGELTVRQPWSPGGQMDLVDGERRLVHRDRRPGAPSTPGPPTRSARRARSTRWPAAPRCAGPSGRP